MNFKILDGLTIDVNYPLAYYEFIDHFPALRFDLSDQVSNFNFYLGKYIWDYGGIPVNFFFQQYKRDSSNDSWEIISSDEYDIFNIRGISELNIDNYKTNFTKGGGLIDGMLNVTESKTKKIDVPKKPKQLGKKVSDKNKKSNMLLIIISTVIIIVLVGLIIIIPKIKNSKKKTPTIYPQRLMTYPQRPMMYPQQ